MFDTTPPHRRHNPSSAQVSASTCHSPWVTLKAPGPHQADIISCVPGTLGIEASTSAGWRGSDAGQVRETLDSCPPAGQLDFFPGKGSDAGQVARPGQANASRTWSAMKNDENFNMSIRHVEGIRCPGQQGGWLRCRAGGRRLLCRAGGREASMPGRRGRVARRSAQPPPYDRMIRMIRMTWRAGCQARLETGTNHFWVAARVEFRVEFRRRKLRELRSDCSDSCRLRRAKARTQNIAPLSLEGVSQMDSILPERLLALVRPAFDLVLRRIRSLKRCVQACGCKIMTRYAVWQNAQQLPLFLQGELKGNPGWLLLAWLGLVWLAFWLVWLSGWFGLAPGWLSGWFGLAFLFSMFC